MAEKKPTKRNVLGRGLGALLDDSSRAETKRLVPNLIEGNLGFINVSEIETNPYQPRTKFEEESLNELAESIVIHGIIQPITVRQLSTGKYQLISGERRLQASVIADQKSIPAFIRLADDQQMLEMALIENIQRENLNAIEIALSYQRLISECKLKQEQLGDRVGKKRTTVNNYLRLLRLPPDIQIAVRDNEISMGHARAIVSIENVDVQLALFKKIIKEDLSVRKVEALVRKLSSQTKDQPPKPETKSETHSEISNLQKDLSSHFGSKVVVKSTDAKKGEIRIPFLSVEDLNRILDILEVQ
jgi:ParB family chromosome partitioning protein